MATRKPSWLYRLALAAGVLFVLRYSIPAAAGHPLGRVILLAAAWLIVSFGLGFYLRIKRSMSNR